MRSLRLVAFLAIAALVAGQKCDDMVSSLGLQKAKYGVTFKPNLSNIKHTTYNVAVHLSANAPGTYSMYRDQLCAVTNSVGWGYTGGDTAVNGLSLTADADVVDFTVQSGGAPGYLWTCCTAAPGKRSFFPQTYLGPPTPSLCLSNFICFPFDVVTGAGGGGDPVFFAFHSAAKFHWQGIGGKVFVVLSDPSFQFNALLVPNVMYGNKLGTWMTAFGLRSHNASLVIHANRTVSINGGPLVAYSALTVQHLAAIAPTFSAFEIRKNALHLHVPNWGLTISFETYRKNNLTQPHLNFRIEDMFASKNVSGHAIDGVLGGTYATLGQPIKGKCNPGHQGGCLVPYAPETYFVPSNDLLATVWARSTYTASAGLATANVRSVAPVVAGSVLGNESHSHAH